MAVNFLLGATSFAGSNPIETLLTAGFDVVGVSRSDEYGELFSLFITLKDQL